MRVAIAVEGTRGDVYPMLALARSLGERGHDVAFCAPPDFREIVEAQDLEFHPVGRNVRAYLECEAVALHSGAVAMMQAGERFFTKNLPSQMRDLALGAQGADLVIAAGTQLAASSVAESVGAAYQYVCYDPGLLRSAEQPPAFLPFAKLPRWGCRLAWWLVLASMEVRLRPTLDRERSFLGLRPVRDLYQSLLGERPLVAAEELLAPLPTDGPEALAIGCLHPFQEGPLPEKLLAFLEAGEPPVFIGFGSMTDPNPKASTQLLLEAVAKAGVRAVISEGWAGLGDAALPSDVMVVGPMSHASLFQRMAAVVHHGGAGTTTMAARAGTPQIVVPHVLDQFHWGRRVSERSLGPPPVPRRKLTAAKLATAIRSLLDNDVVAERAAETGRELRAAMEDRGSPADVIG